jgi:hypothetical protein
MLVPQCFHLARVFPVLFSVITKGRRFNDSVLEGRGLHNWVADEVHHKLNCRLLHSIRLLYYVHSSLFPKSILPLVQYETIDLT